MTQTRRLATNSRHRPLLIHSNDRYSTTVGRRKPEKPKVGRIHYSFDPNENPHNPICKWLARLCEQLDLNMVNAGGRSIALRLKQVVVPGVSQTSFHIKANNNRCRILLEVDRHDPLKVSAHAQFLQEPKEGCLRPVHVDHPGNYREFNLNEPGGFSDLATFCLENVDRENAYSRKEVKRIPLQFNGPRFNYGFIQHVDVFDDYFLVHLSDNQNSTIQQGVKVSRSSLKKAKPLRGQILVWEKGNEEENTHVITFDFLNIAYQIVE
jgi:hypothetical protein